MSYWTTIWHRNCSTALKKIPMPFPRNYTFEFLLNILRVLTNMWLMFEINGVYLFFPLIKDISTCSLQLMKPTLNGTNAGNTPFISDSLKTITIINPDMIFDITECTGFHLVIQLSKCLNTHSYEHLSHSIVQTS